LNPSPTKAIHPPATPIYCDLAFNHVFDLNFELRTLNFELTLSKLHLNLSLTLSQLLPLYLFLSLSVPTAFGTDLKLGWLPNSETNIQGYKVYYGTKSHNYSTVIDISNPSLVNGLVTVNLTGFVPYTTYYFSLTSYNDKALSSDFSPELTWICQFHYDSDIFVNPSYRDITLNCFSTINEGYLAINEYGDIYISADEYFEDLNFNQPKQVYLSAGWEDDFHLNSSCTTTIHGTLTITAGTITLDNLIITPPQP